MNKKKRIENHLISIEKKFDIDLSDCKKELEKIEDSKINYKAYFRNIKTVIIDRYHFKELNLRNFSDWTGGINVIKLDAFLFNQLISKEKNLYSLSGMEKLELYIKDKKELKKLKYLI